MAPLILLPSFAFADHLFRPVGTISLSNGYHVDVMTEKAADWGQAIFTLFKDGDSHPIAVQRAPTYPTKISRLGLLNIDLDHNNRPEYLIIGGAGAETSDEITTKQQISWPSANNQNTDWVCGFTTIIIIHDDMKHMDVIKYSNADNPLASSSFQVMGPDRAKAIIGGKTEERLSVTPGFLIDMWKTYVNHFNPECKKSGTDLPLPLAIKEIPLNALKWQDYLPYLLEMYANAQQAYQDAIREGGADYRKKALGVFRFRHFFSTFPFDAVDPENKEPRYTALMNDYAFYLYNYDIDGLDQLRKENKSSEVDYCERNLRESAIPILQHVLKREPTRTVAWLNLADAQWEVPELHAESANTYRRYLDLLHRSAPHSKPPKRALQRAK
ncbi:hypothetical protein [Azospira inquinata]|uniref:Uncharacterized protein n=1 Tax=Azospira inquinata TaxID=2785627 RepID=A0A975SNI0_9RHOO|nr:hypothetical protein [Azospira inquinata]QWT45144.1 hypothetical protein J8L76_09270 [Azospira inquinata]QWT49523.1 hypothetical protein Azoinq_02610 [Azospira inquinata]